MGRQLLQPLPPTFLLARTGQKLSRQRERASLGHTPLLSILSPKVWILHLNTLSSPAR